jgi:uncharacterized SAM-binding protein YcdF (DUF218 family)
MFIVEWIYKFIRSTLAGLGFSVIVLLIFSIYTDYPASLFEKLLVKPDPVKSDVIVVLGAGVTKEGWPGKTSLSRAIKGIVLYRQGLAPKIIFAGGWAQNDFIASATAMADIASKLGVPEKDIFIDDTSRTTYENAINAKKIMAEQGMKSAIIVTSASHMRRSMAIFGKLNIPARPVPVEEFIPSPQHNWRSKLYNINLLYQAIYESMAIIKYKKDGQI